MHSFFILLTVIQGFISQSIGIFAVLKGSYKPQRMTRLIYLLMSILIVGALFLQGSQDAIFLAIAQGIGTALLFLLSLKYGVGGTTKLDFATLISFIIILIIWKLTNDPVLALFLSILTDLIGFIPTAEKTWRLPHTEEWKFYFSDVLASTFSLLSLSNFSLGNVAFPIYIFILNLSGVVLILGRRKALGK
jgi:hypothetical protein